VIDRALTPREIAQRWACKTDTVLALIHTGQLRGFNIGKPGALKGRYRVALDSLVEFENLRGAGPKTRTARPKRQTSDDYVSYF
jgi:hypothetical protein